MSTDAKLQLFLTAADNVIAYVSAQIVCARPDTKSVIDIVESDPWAFGYAYGAFHTAAARSVGSVSELEGFMFIGLGYSKFYQQHGSPLGSDTQEQLNNFRLKAQAREDSPAFESGATVGVEDFDRLFDLLNQGDFEGVWKSPTRLFAHLAPDKCEQGDGQMVPTIPDDLRIKQQAVDYLKHARAHHRTTSNPRVSSRGHDTSYMSGTSAKGKSGCLIFAAMVLGVAEVMYLACA